ncbi:MAG: DUF4340 domain-containing protein [Burkholderiales bacterium]
MKKSWLTNAVLLIAVAALGGFVYFKPRSDQPATYAVSMLASAQVTTLRLERAGQAPVALEKRDGIWHITAPVTAPADAFQVQRLLDILDARASGRLAATDLARFDLERPAARLTIDAQTFSFGTVSSVAHEQYVLSGDAVYTLEPRYGAALPADFTQLIRRRLLADSEMPARFEFDDFAVENSGGRWRLAPAPASDVSQDDFNRWVDDWRLASALRVVPYNGKNKPVARILIAFGNGEKLSVGILQREPELVLLRPDLNLQYSFFTEVGRKLLMPPAHKE